MKGLVYCDYFDNDKEAGSSQVVCVSEERKVLVFVGHDGYLHVRLEGTPSRKGDREINVTVENAYLLLEDYYAATEAFDTMQSRLRRLCKEEGVTIEEDECVEKK